MKILSGVARKWGEGAQQEFFLSTYPCPGFFQFRDCFNLFTWILACFRRDRRKYNACFSLVVFEIFTVKLLFFRTWGGTSPIATQLATPLKILMGDLHGNAHISAERSEREEVMGGMTRGEWSDNGDLSSSHRLKIGRSFFRHKDVCRPTHAHLD